MKRLALVALYLLVFCAGTAFAGGPNGPAGMPSPFMGGPPGAGMPGLGALHGAPDCGTSLCQPVPPCPSTPGLFGLHAAWQVNSDIGKIKFSTQGTPMLLGEEATSLQFNVNGVWVGVSSRVPLGDWLSARAEGRILVPSQEGVTNVTQIAAAPSVTRTFAPKYRWGIVDGSLAVICSPWLSVIGGLRWDSLYVFMSNPPNIAGFSSSFDESDLTISAIQPYIGFEAAWAGKRSALVLKGSTSPWVSTRVLFGMTFGDPGGAAPIRDDTNALSKRSSFQELSLHYIVRMSSVVNVGAFGSVNMLWSHAESDLNSTQVGGQTFTQTFDVDLNRTVYMVGGTLSMAFGPFL